MHFDDGYYGFGNKHGVTVASLLKIKVKASVIRFVVVLYESGVC